MIRLWIYLACMGLFCVLALGTSSEVLAQNTRQGNSQPAPSDSKVFMNNSKKSGSGSKGGLKYKAAPTKNEFLEARLKEKAKMAKDMKKPQYSDKSYFGHKRPPKKNKTGKRKLCKECGIVH